LVVAEAKAAVHFIVLEIKFLMEHPEAVIIRMEELVVLVEDHIQVAAADWEHLAKILEMLVVEILREVEVVEAVHTLLAEEMFLKLIKT
jgi:hypothetical protein